MKSFIPKQFRAEFLFEWKGFAAQLCTSTSSKNLAYQLRYRAYASADLIQEQEEEILCDHFDKQANTRIHLLWHDNKPVATIRSSIWSERYEWASTESINKYKKEVAEHLGLETKILESCRFAIAPELKGRKSLMAQLLLFRIQDLSSRFDECQQIITAVREKHVSFYQRMLGFEPISEAKQIDWVAGDIVLLNASREVSLETITKRGMPPCTEEEISRYFSLAQNTAQYERLAA